MLRGGRRPTFVLSGRRSKGCHRVLRGRLCPRSNRGTTNEDHFEQTFKVCYIVIK
jgi:hypothetical protein